MQVFNSAGFLLASNLTLYKPYHLCPEKNSLSQQCIANYYQYLKLDVMRPDSFLPSVVTAVQTVSSVGKVEVCLRKVLKAMWTQVGQPLESHDSFIQSKHRGESTACPMFQLKKNHYVFNQ